MKKHADANQTVMKQLLSLPIILGLLLVIMGAAAILITRNLSNKVVLLNDNHLGPALVFSEIIDNLNKIEIQSLKLHENKSSIPEKIKIVNRIKTKVKKIDRLESAQLGLSQGQVYEKYLTAWHDKWKQFEASIDQLGESVKANEDIEPKLAMIDENIVVLDEEMGNINSFIHSDVKEIMDETSKISKLSLLILSSVLFVGLCVALFSSLIIVRNIKKLFGTIHEAKQSIIALLNNLDQGFFTFNKDGMIQPEVSKAALNFFGTELSGHQFTTALPVDPSLKKSAADWQELIYSETLEFDEFKPVAPRSFELGGKYIELDFRPIFNENKKLNKVICIASDKSAERKFKQVAEEETALVKIVMLFIKDSNGFTNFISEMRSVIQRTITELNLQKPDAQNLFREMHSLKGSLPRFIS